MLIEKPEKIRKWYKIDTFSELFVPNRSISSKSIIGNGNSCNLNTWCTNTAKSLISDYKTTNNFIISLIPFIDPYFPNTKKVIGFTSKKNVMKNYFRFSCVCVKRGEHEWKTTHKLNQIRLLMDNNKTY